jgi:hypothetical protein
MKGSEATHKIAILTLNAQEAFSGEAASCFQEDEEREQRNRVP